MSDPPSSTRTAGMRALMSMRSVITPVIRTLLRSPLHRLISGKLLLITTEGRKTGNQYVIPVAYAREHEHVLVGTSAQWWRNLAGGQPVVIRLRGRSVAADAQVVTDIDEMTTLYAAMLAANPAHARSAGIHLTSAGSVDRQAVARAAAHGEVIIRLLPHADAPD
jgi:deazaflavin-dependent oxidoreductase (nitroreductase family)